MPANFFHNTGDKEFEYNVFYAIDLRFFSSRGNVNQSIPVEMVEHSSTIFDNVSDGFDDNTIILDYISQPFIFGWPTLEPVTISLTGTDTNVVIAGVTYTDGLYTVINPESDTGTNDPVVFVVNNNNGRANFWQGVMRNNPQTLNGTIHTLDNFTTDAMSKRPLFFLWNNGNVEEDSIDLTVNTTINYDATFGLITTNNAPLGFNEYSATHQTDNVVNATATIAQNDSKTITNGDFEVDFTQVINGNLTVSETSGANYNFTSNTGGFPTSITTHNSYNGTVNVSGLINRVENRTIKGRINKNITLERVFLNSINDSLNATITSALRLAPTSAGDWTFTFTQSNYTEYFNGANSFRSTDLNHLDFRITTTLTEPQIRNYAVNDVIVLNGNENNIGDGKRNDDENQYSIYDTNAIVGNGVSSLAPSFSSGNNFKQDYGPGLSISPTNRVVFVNFTPPNSVFDPTIVDEYVVLQLEQLTRGSITSNVNLILAESTDAFSRNTNSLTVTSALKDFNTLFGVGTRKVKLFYRLSDKWLVLPCILTALTNSNGFIDTITITVTEAAFESQNEPLANNENNSVASCDHFIDLVGAKFFRVPVADSANVEKYRHPHFCDDYICNINLHSGFSLPASNSSTATMKKVFYTVNDDFSLTREDRDAVITGEGVYL